MRLTIQALSRCSRTTTAKKCTKKRFFLLIKPISFCRSRCRRRRRCFKLPNIGAGRPLATSSLSRPLPGLKKAKLVR